MADFNVNRVSPSRIGTYADCGQKFKFSYIDRITPERKGSAALFGTVMHKAREAWVMDRTLDMVELTRAAWLSETKDEPVIAAALAEYQKISVEVQEVCHEIKLAWALKGKESKAPRRTKEFTESPVNLKLKRWYATWLPKLETSSYEFRPSDPLPSLYDESLVLAATYAERYRHLPVAYVSELAFDFEWETFNLVGFIDDVSPLLDQSTGEFIGVGIVDCKTYRAEPDHEFKDWRQGAIYRLAFQWLLANGFLDHLPVNADTPIYFGIDRMRLGDYRWYQPDDRDVRRLLMELRMYRKGVENEIFLPASKTCKAEWCDFKDACSYFHGASAEPLELNVA